VALYIAIVMAIIMLATVVFSNRTLVFEQKTSANQYRATIALEAAEAGLEWGTAMLDKFDKIDASCATSTVTTDTSFRQRYLTIDPATGALTPKAGTIHAACVGTQTGTGWSCSCPVPGTAPNPTVPTVTSGVLPSFAIALVASPTVRTVQLMSYGCTSAITSTTCGGDAAASVGIALGPIHNGLSAPPGAPLTVKGSVDVGDAAIKVVNGDPAVNGITVDAGGDLIAPKLQVLTVPGTPPWTSVVSNDAALSNATTDQMFVSFFGMPKDVYKNLPSVVRLPCPCSTSDIVNAYQSGARQLWLNGNLTLGTVGGTTDVGSATDPLIIVVDGTVDPGGNSVIYGLVYSTGNWVGSPGSGNVLIKGAAVTEGNYLGRGAPVFYYEASVLGLLRSMPPLLIRVPGSWHDFPPPT
jgi:hypothetical protein